jgi:phosphate transport system substrate-binding protein
MRKSEITKAVCTAGALLFSGMVLVNCGGGSNNQGSKEAGGTISIDGSSTVYPLAEAVAEEFQRASPDVRVTVGLSGTGGGFKKFGRGEIDINNASRPIKTKEADACRESGITFAELQVAFDGLAVIVNPENNWCTDITVAELKKIWEPAAQGKIKKWSQVRDGWPDQEIHLFGAGVESGTYDYFTEAIVGESHSSRGDYTASEDDNVLVQGIKADKNALGFFGLAYYTENADKLKLVAVNNGSGPVLPSEKTVKDKSYAPLSRPLFIYVSNKAASRAEVRSFVNFFLDNSVTLAKEVGYVAMTGEEIAAQKTAFEKFSGGGAK